MNTAPQELLKEYVKSQHFTSTAEIMAAMKEMFRDVAQTALEVELDEELGRERCQRAEASDTAPNYRNGYSRKTVKTQLGEVDIKVPRDRNGTFEPKLIGKYSRNADGMEEKILALYACGMSQRDISEQVKELYDVEISPELVTKITEKIMPEVAAWQNRPLEKVYPFIFMDAIHYKVKEDHRYVTKAAYVVLGITMDGRKDILGVWIGEHESSKFWLNVLNDLKSRGEMLSFEGVLNGIDAHVLYKKKQIKGGRWLYAYKDAKKAAQEEAEAIMDAAREEIIGMIKDEGMDHVDEELQEKVEQAQENKEKKQEEEEKLEAIREEKAQVQSRAEAAREKAKENEERAEELLDALPAEEMLQMKDGRADFQQELKDIMNRMKLMAEDLKGAAVDATL